MSTITDVSTRKLQNVQQSKLLQCPVELLKLIVTYLRSVVELKHFTHTCSLLFNVVDTMDWFVFYQVHNPTKRFIDYGTDYWKRISLRRYGYDHIFKVVLAGDSYVGKSNLVLRFTKNEFNVASRARTRVESTAKYIQINEKIIKAQIWDAAGKDHDHASIAAYYRGAIGVVLVYDIARRATFESLGRWLKEARELAHPNAVIILVGNKSDSYHLRAVPTDQATRFAKLNGVSFFETSAFDSTNVEILFQRLFTEISRTISDKALEM